MDRQATFFDRERAAIDRRANAPTVTGGPVASPERSGGRRPPERGGRVGHLGRGGHPERIGPVGSDRRVVEDAGLLGADRRQAMGRRWIHRRGVLFRAELRHPSASAAAEVRPALVRLSSTFDWPRPLPDWVGMAIRLADDHGHADGNGDGDPLDLTLVSSVSGPTLWSQIRTSRDPLACSYSSVVRYRIGGGDRVVVAVPSTERSGTIEQLATGEVVCPIAFRLAAGDRPGAWRHLGELVLLEPIADDPSLRFRPPQRGPRLITRMRTRVYAWSRH